MWPWTERRRELIQHVSFYFPKTQDEVNPESEDEVETDRTKGTDSKGKAMDI